MIKILLVEDQPLKIKKIKELIFENFDSDSFTIETTSTTSDTMSFLMNNTSLDLMILDLNLPVRTGDKIRLKSGLKLLREINRRSNILVPESIIGLTADGEIKEEVNKVFNNEGWVLASYDLKETSWEDVILNKINYLIKKMESKRVFKTKNVVILTAIKEEYLSVRRYLKEIEDNDIDGTSYEKGKFYMNNKFIVDITIRECGAKNSIAAIETERAIQYFNPDMIIFVGIAGSRKQNDFKVGDVLIPEKIYSYEAGKANKEMFMARPDSAFLSYTFLETAKKERLKDDWKVLLGDNSLKQKVDFGIIASGDQLIEHYDSDIGKIITQYYNDTSAVEMEGFGFSKAVSRQGFKNSKMIVGLVRGISDIIEQNDEAKKIYDRRPKNAKETACASASAFTFWMIYKIYT